MRHHITISRRSSLRTCWGNGAQSASVVLAPYKSTGEEILCHTWNKQNLDPCVFWTKNAIVGFRASQVYSFSPWWSFTNFCCSNCYANSIKFETMQKLTARVAAKKANKIIVYHQSHPLEGYGLCANFSETPCASLYIKWQKFCLVGVSPPRPLGTHWAEG